MLFLCPHAVTLHFVPNASNPLYPLKRASFWFSSKCSKFVQLFMWIFLTTYSFITIVAAAVDANTSGSPTSAVGSTSVGSQDQQPTSTGFSQDRGTISALFGLNGGSLTSSSISSHPWKLKWWILFCETKFNHPPAQGPNCLLLSLDYLQTLHTIGFPCQNAKCFGFPCCKQLSSL